MPTIAVLQMCSGIDPEANLAVIEDAARQCAKHGALMLFTPEMSLLLDRDRARSAGHVAREADSLWLPALQAMARRHGLPMPTILDDVARVTGTGNVSYCRNNGRISDTPDFGLTANTVASLVGSTVRKLTDETF